MALRIQLKLRLHIRDGVFTEFFQETKFFSGGAPERSPAYQENNSKYTQSPFKKSGPLPIGLNNIARSYQDLLQEVTGPVRRLWLIEAQEGLILAMTSQDCLVH